MNRAELNPYIVPHASSEESARRRERNCGKLVVIIGLTLVVGALLGILLAELGDWFES